MLQAILVAVGNAKKPQGKGSAMTYPCIGKPREQILTNNAQTTKVVGEGSQAASQPIVEGIIHVGYMYRGYK